MLITVKINSGRILPAEDGVILVDIDSDGVVDFESYSDHSRIQLFVWFILQANPSIDWVCEQSNLTSS